MYLLTLKYFTIFSSGVQYFAAVSLPASWLRFPYFIPSFCCNLFILERNSFHCFFAAKKNTLPLTETRKRKGVELKFLLSYQSQHVRTSKAGTSRHSARHLKHF